MIWQKDQMCLLGQICSFPAIHGRTQIKRKRKCRKKEIVDTITKYTSFLRRSRLVLDNHLQLSKLKLISKKSICFFPVLFSEPLVNRSHRLVTELLSLSSVESHMKNIKRGLLT